jgi:hypothetical protein
MGTGNLFGTGFAQGGFGFDPNLSPNNQAFSNAVVAVVNRLGIGTGGTGGGGTGSVTSVGLTEDGGTGLFNVSGSPVTTSGVINLALQTQSPRRVFAGPGTGTLSLVPTFRTIALGTDLSDVTVTSPAFRQPLVWDGTSHWINGTNYQPLFQRGASFSGGVSVITIPTNNAAIYIPEDCTIIGVEVLTAGGTGSCVLDIWRTPYGSYPPTVANSITAAAKPTINGDIKYRDTTLTGWSTALSSGDTLLVNLTSCSIFTYVMLVLTMQPTGSTVYDGYTDAKAKAAVETLLTAPSNKVSSTATAGTSTFFMRADGAPALDWGQAPTWTAGHIFNGPGAQVVIGTSTGYAWGTGTKYPILQMAGIGGIMGTDTMGLVAMAGGLYYNGTNYIYGQAGTGIVMALGTGSLTVSCVATSGTAAGTAAITTVFSISGTVTSNAIKGYGPIAAALVDMTPDTGTFTVTYTGFSGTALTATARWVKFGNEVTIYIPTNVSGTSNATTFTLTGIPSAIQATVAQNSPVVSAQDNTVQCYGVIGIGPGGTWTMNKFTNGAAGFGVSSTWTGSGTKGLLACSFSYLLN